MAIRISVVVAVYNPGPHMDQLINSLLLQTLPREDFEVIFVDDDSTDGSRQRLEAFAAGQQNVHVFHNSPNSGWPGTPRNIGIEAARGQYLFFADHDDWLPASALRDLCDFADRNGSDVVIPKEVGHGHSIPWEAFRRTIVRAELGVDPILQLPTPHKLFRRAMIDAHGIRFPEGKVRLEDHLFITKAYFAAEVISIYSERACYHWVHRDDTNASLQPFDPRDYYRDLDKVLDVVAANTEPGPLRNALYGQWYSANMLRRLGSERFVGLPADQQRALFDEVRRIVQARFEPSMDEALAPADRVRAFLVRADRFDLIVELARADVGITTSPALTELRWCEDELVLGVSVTQIRSDGTPLLFDDSSGRALRVLPPALDGHVPAEAHDLTDWLPGSGIGLVLRDRSTHEVAEVAVESTVGAEHRHGHQVVVGTARAVLDPRTAFGGRPLPRVVDVYTRFETCGWRSERRVPFDSARTGGHELLVRSMDCAEVSAYATAGTANLSIKRLGRAPRPRRAEPDQPATPASARPARVAAPSRPARVRRRAARLLSRFRDHSRARP